MGLGRKQIQPASESRSVFRLHGDKFHAHTLEGLACSDDGTRSHLAGGYIQQQLDESSWRKWFRSTNVYAAQPQIVHGGDKSLAGGLPGQNRPARRRKPRIATKVVCGRHGNARKNETPFPFSGEDIETHCYLAPGDRRAECRSAPSFL